MAIRRLVMDHNLDTSILCIAVSQISQKFQGNSSARESSEWIKKEGGSSCNKDEQNSKAGWNLKYFSQLLTRM